MKLLRWLFRNKRKRIDMDLKDKTLEELKDELSTKDFLWIKGELQGRIERYSGVVKEGDLTFVEFKDGGRMNIDLLSEFMDMSLAIPPGNAQQSNVAKVDSRTANTPATPVRGMTSISAAEVEDSPIYTLLKKQKEHWVNVNLTLKLNLPPKNLYRVLLASFDDAEKEVVDFITEGIDILDIREALSRSIHIYYDEKRKSSMSLNDKKNNEIDAED